MQQAMQQLDIFADSRDVMLRNAVLEPLERRDAAFARTALEGLAAEYPDDGALSAMTVLVGELERAPTERGTGQCPAVIWRTKWCTPRGGYCPSRAFTDG